MKKIIIFCVVLIVYKGFSQTNYFVKPTGDDNANGLSIGTAWQTIQKAANTVPPGSTVNIMGGTYNELITINVSGTFGNLITFKNYQNEEVIIHPPTNVSTSASLLTIIDRSYIYIRGLIFENLTAQDARGIYVSNTRFVQVKGILIENVTVRNIKYTNNTNPIPTINDQAHAILFVGRGVSQSTSIDNIIINNCTINNNITGYAESVTITGNVSNYYIGNNYIFNNSNIGLVAAGNYQYNNTNNNLPTDYNIPDFYNHARYGLITGNIVHNNQAPTGIADNAGIYCDGCHDTTIEKNTSYNNKIGISINCENQSGTTNNVTVKNNIIYNNLYEGLQVGASNQLYGIVNNTLVTNNTLFKNSITNDSNLLTRGEIKISKVNNCNLYNNIFYCSNNFLFYIENNVYPQIYTMNYNCFYADNYNLSEIQLNYQFNYFYLSNYISNYGQDTNSIYANPQFVNASNVPLDFHISNNSPCINTGNPSFVPEAGETDYFGNSKVSGTYIDIGADEYRAPLFNNQNIKLTFKMFPNPSYNNVTITFDNLTTSNGIIKIYDLFSKQIFESDIKGELQIDVSRFQNGFYLVNFESENKKETQKLIIEH